MPFPVCRQHDAMDCGPACLRIVARHHGQSYTLEHLRGLCQLARDGVSLYGICQAAEKIGLSTLPSSIPYEKLRDEAPLPCIVHWEQRHFVVVYKCRKGKVHVSDPAHGLVTYPESDFKKGWLSHQREGEAHGIALFLEPTPRFHEQEDEGKQERKFGLGFMFRYIFAYKALLVQLGVGLFAGSLFGLILPFLTQAMVDIGIGNSDINFIYLILAAQIMLFAGNFAIGFIRSWILLHLGARMSIRMVSDFLAKLMKLPIAYFDTKLVGDILQRIGDHSRVQNFLTNSVLGVVFTLIHLVVFGVVLYFYHIKLFWISVLGSALYVGYILLFLRQRRSLDVRRFGRSRENQETLVQLVTGMQEIKLHGCELQHRWKWERIQAKLYRISMDGLKLSQYQGAGASFLNEIKNILLTIISATAVINGEMTLGMMMAVQYIIGQLNGSITSIIPFIHAAQDARISVERLGEIHNRLDEEQEDDKGVEHSLPAGAGLGVQNLSFQYPGAFEQYALKDVSLKMAPGKVTAIVGTSGSGKTTLIKMLLKYYQPTEGEIRLGQESLALIGNGPWRRTCGVVMQDGFIFSDTIARNIAPADENIDPDKLRRAMEVACLREYVEALPMGYNTKIGADGQGLSQGQKQRILIARAVYKDPQFLFFDEATNALDANNERAIIKNLATFFKGRTVVIVAHRLSTVKNADLIAVLEQGRLVEHGNHNELVRQQGAYYRLVKNQLELGN